MTHDLGNPHVALFLPTLEGGGAERAIVELANQFSKLGVKVDLVLANATGKYRDEIAGGVRVVDFQARGVLASLPKLVLYLRRERPAALVSVLNHANVIAAIACKLARTPSRSIFTQRCAILRTSRDLARPYSYRFALYAQRFFYLRASLIICNSHAASADLQEVFGVDRSKLVVIHNAVDQQRISLLAEEQIEHPWVAADAPPLLLTVGSLTPRKNLETLFQALAIVRRTHECNLIVLGEGQCRKQLEALSETLAIDPYVALPGFDHNPFRWMKRARMMISSTLAEGCPNVIQQALACGTPIVATDCHGGTSEILEHGKWGRLVPVENPQAMADAIIATLEDNNPTDGRVRAADFDSRRNAEEYLRFILPDFVPKPTSEDWRGVPAWG